MIKEWRKQRKELAQQKRVKKLKFLFSQMA
jgi:hypothetical protein